MSPRRLSRRTMTSAAIAMTAALGCASPPLEWSDARPLAGVLSDRSILVMRAESAAALAERSADVAMPPGPACGGTVRTTPDGRGTLFAAWWSPRDDSSSVLLVARRPEGGAAWDAPVVADARDSSRIGCDRPAPAIAADGVAGYVYLAYFLDSPTDGRGLYAGHSMDRGAYFHAPVPIVFGDRPVRAAVAASGDLVAVAYEDPNSERARVALAVSITAGHIYEHRVDASPSSMRASRPEVAVAGRRIAVAWNAEEWAKGAQGSRAMVRIAVLTGGDRGVWKEEEGE